MVFSWYKNTASHRHYVVTLTSTTSSGGDPPPPPYLRVWMSALPSPLSQGLDPALRPAIQAHSVTT